MFSVDKNGWFEYLAEPHSFTEVCSVDRVHKTTSFMNFHLHFGHKSHASHSTLGFRTQSLRQVSIFPGFGSLRFIYTNT